MYETPRSHDRRAAARAMTAVNLTDRLLRSLKAPPGGEMEVQDAKVPGLSVRVSGLTGSKTWTLRYRGRDKRRRRVTLGRYPDVLLAEARNRAKRQLGLIAHGVDPAAMLADQKTAPTFGELAAEYMERHAKPNKKSWPADASMLARDLLPAWERRPAASISRRDVREMLDGILDRGAPFGANRTRALVSVIFSFALSRDIVELNPVAGVPRPAPPRSRQRVLTEDEIRLLWVELATAAPLVAAYFRLLLLTAQRGIEVRSMRHEDIDGDWWTIPAERSKNGLAHRVPLSPQSLATIRSLAADGSPWVFSSPSDDGHLRHVGRTARAIRARVGFDFVPHDLRRTAATIMTSMGIARLVVSKILNHAEPGVTAVYDRASYDADKRRALTAWGDRLERIVTGRPVEQVAGRIGA